jgi:hypothetical protein
MTNFLSNGVDLADILYLSTTQQTNMSEVPNYLTGGNKWYALTYPVTNPPTNYGCVTSPTNYLMNGTDVSQTFSPIYDIITNGIPSFTGTYNINPKCTRIYFVLIGNGGRGGNGNSGSNAGAGGGGGGCWGYFVMPTANYENLKLNYYYNLTEPPNTFPKSYITITGDAIGGGTPLLAQAYAYAGTTGNTSVGGSGEDGGFVVTTGNITCSFNREIGGSGGGPANYTTAGGSGYNRFFYPNKVNYPFSPDSTIGFGNGGQGSNQGGTGQGGAQGIIQLWFVY